MKDLYTYILEKQSINFGSAKSNYGQCIILAGGPGSGKGYVKDHRILADFKSIDVDKLKEMYMKLQEKGKIDDPKKYDLGNTKDVSELHMKVKERGWKNKQREHFWKDHQSSAHLPNIVWDMVSDDIKDVEEILKYAKPIGYNITLVWVCCNMDTAREGNQKRDRHVDDAVIVKGHKGAYKTMMELFDNKYPEINKSIDNAWIALSAGWGRMLKKEYEKDPVIKIKKDDKGNFDFKQKSMIDNFLKEQQPEDPDWDEKVAAEKDRKKKVASAKFGKTTNESLYESVNGLETLIDEIENEILL